MKPLVQFCIVGWLLVSAVSVFGHGVTLESSIDDTTGDVTVRAAFDTGEVFDEAQVAVFAPDDLINPWLTGVTDSEGIFTFSPDYTIEGVWDVQVRKAGHGGLLHITLDASMAPPEAAAADSGAQPVADAETASTIQLSAGSEIVITGDARFEVSGDIIISTDGGATGTTLTAANSTPTQSDPLGNGFTPTQIVIMSISVIWGFVGTALYFAQRRRSSGAA